MTKQRRFTVFLILLLLAGIGAAVKVERYFVQRRVRAIAAERELAKRNSWHPFSARVSEVIAQASKVEARRIDRDFIKGKVGEGMQVKETLGTPMLLAPDLSRRVSEALRDRDTYEADVFIMCFDPGVQFDFYQDSRRVTVQICFHCQNLTARFDDGQSTEMSREVVFTPGYARLLRLTREAFPDDRDIQSLDEKPK
jgi:hypothetical protein